MARKAAPRKKADLEEKPDRRKVESKKLFCEECGKYVEERSYDFLSGTCKHCASVIPQEDDLEDED